MSAYKPREPGSLKQAQADLVEDCGGLDRAAGLTRVRRTQMGRYTDPADPETNMPADVVQALELHCGNPHVSRFLLLAAGYIAVPVPKKESHPELMRHLSGVLRKTGNLSGHACDAMADGKLSIKECALLRGEAMKTITALSALLGGIDCAGDRHV
jgi:hypothetical protein